MKPNVPSVCQVLALAATLLGAGCRAPRPAAPAILATTARPDSYYENAQKTVAPAAVAALSKDATYGVTAGNPIKVGGGVGGGARREQSYLNALRGPAGQPTTYQRRGSCCPFKTPNGLIDNTGLLDAYTVTWEGNPTPLTLYLNMYDPGELLIPVGFTAAR